MQKGYIFRKGPNWFLRYREPGPVVDGKPTWREVCKKLAPYERPYTSKRAVENLAQKYLNPVNAGVSRPDSTQYLTNFVEQTYLPYVEKNLSPSTLKGYSDIWNNHVKSRLGGMRLRDVRPTTVQVFSRNLADETNLSHISLMHVKDFLSGVFTHARIEYDMIDITTGFKGVKVGGQKSKVKTYAYSLNEIQTLLRILPEPAKTVIATAAFTGLSRSELMGLKWEDFSGDKLEVSRKVWNRILIEKTKTPAREASVPVISILQKVLEAHHKRNPGTTFIFEGIRSRKPLVLENLKMKVIFPALKGSGVQWHGWHAFRRGLATNLYALGVAPKVIQAILRHSNVNTTLAFYVKPPAADSVVALERLEEAFTNGHVEQAVELETVIASQ